MTPRDPRPGDPDPVDDRPVDDARVDDARLEPGTDADETLEESAEEVRDDERKVSDYWKERAEDLEDRVETLEKLLRATRHEAVNARMMVHGLQHAGCQPRTPPTEFRELP